MTLPALEPATFSRATRSAAPTRKPWWRALLELGVTVGLLSLTLRAVDVADVRAHLGSLDPTWLLLGTLATVPQVLGSALRWRFTAQRLGAHISMRRAVREYYVSTLFNQLLPTGMAGDALRVARHGTLLSAGKTGYALSLHTVVLERFAGQIVLWLLVAASAPLWGAPRHTTVAIAAGALVLVAVAVVAHRAMTTRSRRLPTWLSSALAHARSALFERDAWLVQFATSTLVLAGCVAMFACGARALGAPLSLAGLFRIAPLVLASMSIPVSFAGWGVREALTASLYAASGLDPTLGTTVAITYGAMSLVGSLPGAWFWLRRSSLEEEA